MPKEVVKMMRGDIPIAEIKSEMNKRNPKMKYMKFFEMKKSKAKSKKK
jgi:hypothetical protein